MMAKRILFICPKFFGYETEIHQELVSQGHDVDMINDSPTDSGLLKGVIRLFRPLCTSYLDRTFRKKERLLCNTYDMVLIVKGEYLSKDTLQRLKSKFRESEFVYYNWDSVINSPYSLCISTLCDRAYTFDPNDSKKYESLKLLDLFYTHKYYRDELNIGKENYLYDVCFIGTARPGRFSVINLLSNHQEISRLYLYIYVQSKIKNIINKFLIRGYNNFDTKHLKYKPLTSDFIYSVFLDSKSVLDVHHPSQSGLTMRIFECLAANKKIITTNSAIKEYDFFNHNNVLVINDANIVDVVEFLKLPFIPLSNKLIRKYSLRAWVSVLVGCKERRNDK
ncbi:hypothetical protein [Vibrio sp. F74]|uniref:hypothetical protein n=1 Tax=Vibrio sp. F74 TaxID=700020 RepID=UPI0035F59462